MHMCHPYLGHALRKGAMLIFSEGKTHEQPTFSIIEEWYREDLPSVGAAWRCISPCQVVLVPAQGCPRGGCPA